MTIRTLLLSRASMACASAEIVQQLIVATSTLWIARLSADVTAGRSPWLHLGLFLASLTLVYFPGVIGAAFRAKAKFAATARYLEWFIQAHHQRPGLYISPLKEQRLPFLTSESQLVLDEAIRFLSDWFAVMLNVVLNIIMFALVVDARFIGAYALSMIVIALVVRSGQKTIRARSHSAQAARVNFSQMLLSAWDHITIGNHYNQQRWQQQTQQCLAEASATGVRSVWTTQCISTAGMLLAMVPILALLIYLYSQHRNNLVLLTTMTATLPRQILILQHLHVVVMYANEWQALRTRLQGLLAALAPVAGEPPLRNRITWPKISITRDGQSLDMATMQQLLTHHPLAPGRMTVSGSNGAGKSTLLLHLKEALGEHAYYLPARHDLLFETTPATGQSTGERLIAILKEIAHHVQVPVVLLDEWDANLDRHNIAHLSAMIDEMSQRCCVIEVRHRHEMAALA